jgi:Holliday junction resolvasome RuvABC DNA-binding subunit
MGSMTALAILFALAFLALLISRIHFHFSFNLTISRSQRAQRVSGRDARRENAALPKVEAPAVRSISDPGVTRTLEAARRSAEADIVSSLVNLGCDRQKAREVAKRAMEQGKDFDTRIKWAIQNAA